MTKARFLVEYDAVDSVHRIYGHITTVGPPRVSTSRTLRNYCGGYPLEEIAHELGLSRERTRQIEATTLKK